LSRQRASRNGEASPQGNTMKTLTAISAAAAISCVALGATLVAQNQGQSQGQGQSQARPLTKLQTKNSAGNSTGQASPLDARSNADAWRDQLTNSDLEAREQAFDRLIAAA